MEIDPGPMSRPPYPGLRAFRGDEASVFFGREIQIDAVLQRLKTHRFLGVVGSSGCGKSSLIRAGVIPALEMGAMGELGSDWHIADFTPGDTPISNLADGLIRSGMFGNGWSDPELGRAQLIAALRRSDRSLVRRLESQQIPQYKNLLVLVDQFEEIFRFQQQDANEAQFFVRLLLSTVHESQVPIYVMLTMRSDFLGQCVLFEGLPEALNESQFLCPRMSRSQMTVAIKGPAASLGTDVEPALITRLINDAGVNSDQLPLAQHALTRIWQAAKIREQGDTPTRLTLGDYRAVGLLAGTTEQPTKIVSANALSRHCDEAYLELADSSPASRDLGPGHQPSRQQNIVQRMFCALAEMGTAGQAVRRPRTVAALCQLADCSLEELQTVANVFRKDDRSFLRSPTKSASEPLELTDLLDVSHEALLRQWDRLSGRKATRDGDSGFEGWLERDDLARRRYRRIVEAADGEAITGLLKNPELGFLSQWWTEFQPLEAWGNEVVDGSFESTKQFLERSLSTAEAERLAAEEKTRQELEKERAIAEELKRKSTVSMIVAGVALVCALIAGWWYLAAKESESAATKARDEAIELRTKVEIAVRTKGRGEALVYANVIANAQHALDDSNVQLALILLDSTQSNLRGWEYNYLYTLINKNVKTLRGHTKWVASAAYSPDGARIVSGSFDNTLKVWDADAGQEMLTLKGHTSFVASVMYSPDSKWIVSGSFDGKVKVWDATTGQERMTLFGHTAPVNSVAYSPNGARIVSGSGDNTLKVWDATTGQPLQTLEGHTSAVNSVTFSPDSVWIVSGSNDGTLKVWAATTGQETLTLVGHSVPINSVGFSPNGKQIVSGSDDSTLKIWDAIAGTEVLTLHGHTKRVTSVAFSPNGEQIVSGSDDRTLKVWDVTTNNVVQTIEGHEKEVTSVDFSPDGERIVSASGDSTLKVWITATKQDSQVLNGHTEKVTSAAYSPDSAQLVSGSYDNAVIVWNPKTGREIRSLKGHTSPVTCVAYSPDGMQIVSGSHDKKLIVWDAITGQATMALNGHSNYVTSVAYSPDGTRIVSGSRDQTLKIWDVTTGQATLTMNGHDGEVYSVAYSPDGARIVSGSEDNTLTVWNATTGRETKTLKGHTGWVTSVAYSPDSALIVSGSADNTLKVWDTKTWQETLTLKGHTDRVTSVAFSPDGVRIVSGSRDKTMIVWDALTGQKTLTLNGHAWVITSLTFSPNGKQIVSGSEDHQLKVWDASKQCQDAASPLNH